ncbi:hypothetical protein FFH21_027705 [Pseudomonas sp. KBS0707]|nr:hypothetical protein BKM19_029200 [Pseudomonas amygdali pv. morsprunorum]POP91405.1 hypothetical protein CXB39_19640 [Pseudomonas amygdali pv. morsprunorum]PYD22791.1 hypothetical protein DND36_12210 [Pseudomonas savastanoi pv. glycinea]QDW03134.1 hypothetical protein FFH21_027705 [Pseudomonas sp. KBS0707]
MTGPGDSAERLNRADTPLILVPTLRVVMHFVTRSVTQCMPTRSIGTIVSWICVLRRAQSIGTIAAGLISP